jgi:hypothetical protein
MANDIASLPMNVVTSSGNGFSLGKLKILKRFLASIREPILILMSQRGFCLLEVSADVV